MRIVKATVGVMLLGSGCGGDVATMPAGSGAEGSSGGGSGSAEVGSGSTDGGSTTAPGSGPSSDDESAGSTSLGSSSTTSIDPFTSTSSGGGSTGPGATSSGGEEGSSSTGPDPCEVEAPEHTETQLDVEVGASDVVLADFDGDNHLDMATAGVTDGDDMVIYLGDGSGGMTQTESIAAPSIVRDLVAGFVDDDDAVDLITLGGMDTITVWLGDGAGGFAGTAADSMPLGPQMVGGDFNGDDRIDVAVLGGGGSGIEVYLSDGAGGLAHNDGFFTATSPGEVVVADFDGDTVLDLFTQLGELYIGDGAGGFADPVSFGLGGGTTNGLAAGDLNDDGAADIAVIDVVFLGATSLSEIYGDGAGDFNAPLLSGGIGDNAIRLYIEDVNNDAVQDLVMARVSLFAAGSVLFYTRDGCGDWSLPASVTVGNGGGALYPLQLALGDLNEDGIADVVSPNMSDATISLVLSQ